MSKSVKIPVLTRRAAGARAESTKVAAPGSLLGPEEEAALLARIASGDREAFGAFYDRCAERVLGLQYAILGNRTEADDALQDVFWYVWSKAGSYNPALGSPLGWVFMVARSRALDRLRKSRRRMASLELMEGRGEVRAEEPPTTGQAPARVGVPMDVLPHDQRQAVQLAYFRGLTREQIAKVQSVPVGTVKTRIRTGLSRLRKALEERPASAARPTGKGRRS